MNEKIRELCERASRENDGAKLLKLIVEINRLIRDEAANTNGQRALPPAAAPENLEVVSTRLRIVRLKEKT